MHFKQHCLILLTLVLTIGIANADDVKEIYKWKDKAGVVRYTDMPPPIGTPGVTKIKRKASSSSLTQSNTQSPSEVAQPNDDLKQKQQELDKVKKNNQVAEAENAKRKQLNCAAAKANYQSYATGGRVYKTNANGEREYLDDKALADGMAQAQREINENC